jgi:hypothetical protein
VKTTKKRIDAHPLIHNIFEVKWMCWSFGIENRMSDKWVNYSYGFAQTKQQVG